MEIINFYNSEIHSVPTLAAAYQDNFVLALI